MSTLPSKERFQRRVLACDKIQFTQMENGDIEVYFYGDPEPHSVARVGADERKELIEWLRPSSETPACTCQMCVFHRTADEIRNRSQKANAVEYRECCRSGCHILVPMNKMFCPAHVQIEGPR